MAIALNLDRQSADKIRQALRDNHGYCPSVNRWSSDTKCLCKEFREMKSGVCRCGLYIKTAE